MPRVSLDILYEDNHLLVLNKPTRLPTMGAAEGVSTAVLLAKAYIKDKYQKPGNVYLGVVSRLDAMVSGVLPLARTSKAAARLNRTYASGEPEKTYTALVSGPPLPDCSQWEDWIAKDESAHRMFCTRQAGRGQLARLRFEVLARWDDRQLVRIDLQTGRKHQIRTQFAAHGCPVWGDRKYGSPWAWPHGIALHAHRLRLPHPVRPEQLTLVAPLPGAWYQAVAGRHHGQLRLDP